MGLLKLLARAVRRVVRFPLVQLIIVVAVILILQSADNNSVLGRVFAGLDNLVQSTIELVSGIVTVKAFTRSWLTFVLMISYVYLGCLIILYLLRLMAEAIILLVARTNAFGLRDSIARERGIAAYQAWLPFERIRPSHISQTEWEETFAWPPDNKPPYPSLARRILTGIASYIVLAVVIIIMLQILTPFAAITWIAERVQSVFHAIPLR